jgi:SprT protein
MELKQQIRQNRTAGLRPLTTDVFRSLIPDQSVEYILHWFLEHKVRLRIALNRLSKSGDYRPSRHHLPPRISVNNNLNPYDFLITLVHEMAHHEVWRVHIIPKQQLFPQMRRHPHPKPHGQEWQQQFHHLMIPLMNTSVFPPDVLYMVENYFRTLRVTRKFDQDLTRVLKKYDKPNGKEFVENLPFDAMFTLPDGRSFRKKEKLRKRFKCICMNNNRIYLFSPLAQVFHENNEK